MSDETLFYVIGGILAVSAVVVTFAGLKLKNFPGKVLPAAVLWFAVLAVGASTYSVLLAKEHEAHEEHKLEKAGHEIEEAEGELYENEGGALGGEREELEEEAEEEAEGAEEEEPVGPSEGSQEGDEGGQGSSPGSMGTSSGGGDVTAGAMVFAENCSGCHGEDGLGGPGGPDLKTMPLAQTEKGTIRQVTNGGGGMPAFGEQLSGQEISDVAAFVVQDIVNK